MQSENAKPFLQQ